MFTFRWFALACGSRQLLHSVPLPIRQAKGTQVPSGSSSCPGLHSLHWLSAVALIVFLQLLQLLPCPMLQLKLTQERSSAGVLAGRSPFHPVYEKV